MIVCESFHHAIGLTYNNFRILRRPPFAKQRGAYQGRKKSLNSEQIAEIKQRVMAGEQKTLIARNFGISRETLYQYLRTMD